MSTGNAPADPLLRPFRLKHLTLKNRIMSTSHACGLHDGGMPAERYRRYHEEKAKGGNRLVAVFENLVTNETSAETADQIVVEHGTRPADGIFHELTNEARNLGVTDIDALLAGAPQPADQNLGGTYELYRIGDCVTSRNIAAAVYDALRLCRTL